MAVELVSKTHNVHVYYTAQRFFLTGKKRFRRRSRKDELFTTSKFSNSTTSADTAAALEVSASLLWHGIKFFPVLSCDWTHAGECLNLGETWPLVYKHFTLHRCHHRKKESQMLTITSD